MKSARKMRLELDTDMERSLDGQSKIANWLYNRLLEKADDLRGEYILSQDEAVGKTLYTKRGLRDLIPGLKTEHPFLKTVYSSPLKNAALRVSRAIIEYQKSRHGKRKGKGVSWPKFRSWKRKWFSLEYDEPWKGYTLEGRILTLQLGVDSTGKRMSVTCILSESFPSSETEVVKGLRIIKESGQYFAIFTVEKNAVETKEIADPKIIAFDPNHKNLAYGVGTDRRAIEISNLEYLKRIDERIDELKSCRDKCLKKSTHVERVREDGTIHRHYEPSRRWKFFNELLEGAYRKRREQTKTFLHTLANQIFKEYDIIGIGDYAPHGGGITMTMRRSMNNRSLIGRFKDALSWTALKSGKIYTEYEEKGTTRTCHICSHEVEGGLDPSIREWRCSTCGTFHIQDENAAQNGIVRTLEKLKMPRSGHTSVEIQSRWVWQVTPGGVRRLREDAAIQTSA